MFLSWMHNGSAVLRASRRGAPTLVILAANATNRAGEHKSPFQKQADVNIVRDPGPQRKQTRPQGEDARLI
ncbi:hypothetical protein SKAU_G00064990 [Synaphobranchus kaupii]|uniref:Uncharacterized protein n=1 Tax=Synaphobranchus kaupii TaxID=118154 RepID=A0A9Q1G5L4_SYNKA|nr:hypothetical protein SKAU_G00064990 [Synaphobranchus kaupii]